MKVVDRDRGYRDLMKRLGEVKGSGVTVGVHDDQGGDPHGDGLTIAEVALYHELGLGVPERSMLRGFIDEHQDEIRQWQRRAAQAIISGKVTKEQAFKFLGEQILGAVKDRILDGIDPELAESTKKRRGEDATPLVDTGQMIGAFAYKLAEKQ